MEPYEAREIAAKAWCDNSTSHLDMIPELAEAFAKILVEEVGRASPASAPEGFNHSVGAERFTIIRGAFWWHVRAGDGTQNIGKFHTRLAAEDMASTLLTAFRDGAFVQYQAMLAAAPTPPVSEGVDPVMPKEELIAAAESIGMRFPGATIPPVSEDRQDAELLRFVMASDDYGLCKWVDLYPWEFVKMATVERAMQEDKKP